MGENESWRGMAEISGESSEDNRRQGEMALRKARNRAAKASLA